MKLFYTVLFAFMVQQLYAHKNCNENSCLTVKCPQADDCPLGTYKRYTDECQCCSECTTYLKEDDLCTPDGIKCSPGHQCDPKTTTCRPIFLSIYCLRAFGVCKNLPPPDCNANDILPDDHTKCRCCPMCSKDVAEDGTGCRPGFKCNQTTGECKKIIQN